MKHPIPHPRRASRASLRALPLVLVAIVVLVAALAASAFAAKEDHPIKPVSRSDEGATKLAQSIFEGNNKKLVRAKFVAVPPGHDPVATTTRSIAGFPRKGKSFAILSTGCAHLAIRKKNNGGATGCKDSRTNPRRQGRHHLADPGQGAQGRQLPLLSLQVPL